ncbi:hypothetical protein B0A58_14010 [Flavobacterium branchiophilum NBRC 15030 = ATCC 35035]|uniref:DUF4369 domain-containing protein n=2 Tax=Flavobacterium branchiophilum TaxID=55197 RepID=A0A2H3KTL6_9FLAO|nr:DUF4369 domain-containing protein [Flavobacterium branchiophilum]OXA70914.1 hypothetical protein B0A58_14010 [Flavobacterium branchiophilum NBRC 15030 = ATCC 35035]PDS25882.1 DUF4369 domain-containing protein [Flavobacterium branchiophilum]TQM41786.1 uncharacterized protein DUF4369 [Flavobacterium branchiophilum]CCB69369.1 Probable lipoprotein precursor [Flavobacterium branchiophilum FL-15]GEM56423.1 hypothetical protein FB1_26440 [Flavobacterium branchiophilum NBRC 15030 = ATCC 35035]
MKKIILLTFGLFLFWACNEKKSDTNLHITGKIKGLKNGTLYIQKVVDTSLVVLDTIKIDGNDTFESHLKIDSPEMYYLFLDRGVTNSKDNNLLFFAEPGNITIETTLDKFLYDAQVTGSKNNDLFVEHKKITSKYNEEHLNLLEEKFFATKTKNTKKVDSINAVQNANLIRKYLYTVNFAINHRDYEVAPYIALSEIYDVNMKYLDTIQKSMTPKVAQSTYGKKLTQFVADRKKQEQGQ